MIIAKDLRREVKSWFGSLEPRLFATHNFGFRVLPETRERSMRRFYNRLQSRKPKSARDNVGWNRGAPTRRLRSSAGPYHACSSSDRAPGAAEGNFLHHEGDLRAGLTRSAIYLPSAAFEAGELEFSGADLGT